MPHYAAVQQDAAEDRVDDDENKPEELQVEDEHAEEEEAITYHIAKKSTIPKNHHLHPRSQLQGTRFSLPPTEFHE